MSSGVAQITGGGEMSNKTGRKRQDCYRSVGTKVQTVVMNGWVL